MGGAIQFCYVYGKHKSEIHSILVAIYIYICISLLPRAEWDTTTIFKVESSWFELSSTGWTTGSNYPVCSNVSQKLEGIYGYVSFPRALAWSETKQHHPDFKLGYPITFITTITVTLNIAVCICVKYIWHERDPAFNLWSRDHTKSSIIHHNRKYFRQ